MSSHVNSYYLLIPVGRVGIERMLWHRGGAREETEGVEGFGESGETDTARSARGKVKAAAHWGGWVGEDTQRTQGIWYGVVWDGMRWYCAPVFA